MSPAVSPPQGASAATTCVLADGEPAPRRALARALTNGGCQVVREAADGIEAIAAIQELQPGVAVVAAALPRVAGVEVVRRAAEVSPKTAAILCTDLAGRDGLVEALNAGARGFVLNDTPPEELASAVSAVAAGAIYVDPAVGEALKPVSRPDERTPLSSRERDILAFLSKGFTTKDIAGMLFISPETVRTYVRRAMQKLEARTRTQAVAIAIRRSLIT